jgi:hypothetical protein
LRARGADTSAPSPEVRRAAIHEATSKIGAACLLTSVTTGIGFASLAVADMPILRNFGIYAALGIGLAYLGVLLFVPMALTTTRGSIPPAGRIDDPTPTDRVLLACADLSLRRPVWILAVTAVVLATSVWFGQRVVVDNNLTRSLQSTHPVTAANTLADRELGGIIGMEVDLRGEPDALKDPSVLAGLLDFEAWVLQQEGVRQATSPATWVALLHQATTGDYRAPDSAAAAAQFYLLAEGVPEFSRLVDGDYARGRMWVTLQDEGGQAYIKRAEALAEALHERLAGTPITAALTGTPYVAYRGINGVTDDLRASLMLAFVLIAVVITVLFRDVRTGLICLIPNALPLVVGYGVLGMMGWLLDPTPAVVFTVALGIAVDDTLHLLIRYREELGKGRTVDQAIRLAVLHSGRAVVITSAILAFGFGINALSSFTATQTLGYLGATVILTALLSDLFVLPALLKLWGRAPAV